MGKAGRGRDGGQKGVGKAVRQALAGSAALYVASVSAQTETSVPTAITVLPTVTVTGAPVALDEAPAPIAGGLIGGGARMGILGNTSVMDTPFSVTSYTAQTIQNEQARSVADVATMDPSVRMSSARSNINEDLTIRGFNVPTADFAFNGMFGLTPYWRAPVETLERVEIIKGPSAALFGMTPGGSVGGVVNLVPKRATDDPITRVTGSVMSDSVFGVHADVGRRFGPDNAFGIRVNAMLRDGDTPIKDQSTREALGSVALDYRGEKLRSSLDLTWQKERIDNVVRQFQLGSDLDSIPEAPSNKNPYPGLGWSDGRNTAGVFKVEYDITDNLTAYAGYGQSKLDWDAFAANPVLQNTQGDYSFFGGWQRMTVDSKSTEAGLRGNFNTGPVSHKVALGYTMLDQKSDLGFYTGFPPGTSNIYAGNIFDTPSISGIRNPLNRYQRTKLTSYALADTLGFVDDRLQLTVGARHQNVQGQNYNFANGEPSGPRYDKSAITPLAGVVFKILPDVSVYASYVEGLSQGDTAPTSAAITNPGETLSPFKSKQKEIGVKYNLNDDMLATVALFELTRPSSGISGNTFGEFGEQRNRGVEASFAGEVTRGVRLLGGISYIDAIINKATTPDLQGNQAVGVPDWQFNLGAEWDTPFVPGLTLLGRVIYTGRTYADADNTLSVPSWTRVDAGARYETKISGTPVTFRFNVENLFNRNYWGTATAGYLFVGSPRTYTLSTSIAF
ncbi:TonB-dependent receptor [Bordetella genomosp. 11]|uniref:TonB-dependent siderophore receptor n=1 Tax=Bordetella genomosp. 11 TaxID=1416808 RepID=A0A261UQ30_9BORD|nr:TonB-dependent siderophore receptor [Bordetella genomosp. 11]OZI63013.1 TonB-dependent siderophore receptor [Bordetella genomosp. 11]